MKSFVKQLLLTQTANQVYANLVGSGMDSLEAMKLIYSVLSKTDKIKAISFEIVWSAALQEENILFYTWEAFNRKLNYISTTDNANGGSHLVFKVIYADGKIYDGSLFVDKDTHNLGKHMLDYNQRCGGLLKFDDQTEEEYQKELVSFNLDGVQEEIQTFLENYEILV